MATNQVIEERRKQIEKMILEGVERKKIRKKLSISVGTFYRDLEAIQRENAELKDFDKVEEIKGSLQHFDSVEAEAWETYSRATPGSNQAIGALNTLIRTRKERVQLMMDVGVIDKVPEKIKHEFETFEEKVKKMRQERGLDNEN